METIWIRTNEINEVWIVYRLDHFNNHGDDEEVDEDEHEENPHQEHGNIE